MICNYTNCRLRRERREAEARVKTCFNNLQILVPALGVVIMVLVVPDTGNLSVGSGL